jgi:hypothetical protein
MKTVAWATLGLGLGLFMFALGAWFASAQARSREEAASLVRKLRICLTCRGSSVAYPIATQRNEPDRVQPSGDCVYQGSSISPTRRTIRS